MKTESQRFYEQLCKITASVCAKWGVSFPENPIDPKKAVTVAVNNLISEAIAKPFSPVYADDHSWSSIGLRPLTASRLKQDEAFSGLEKSGEEYGVFAYVRGFDSAIIVPIAADLSLETAEFVSDFVKEHLDDFLDLTEAPKILASGSGQEEHGDAEVEVSIAFALWEDVRDVSSRSLLPLSEAVFFRKPCAWDLLRAKMSGSPCSQIPEFVEKSFFSIKDRSVRFDRRSDASTKAILKMARDSNVDLDNLQGRNWFAMVIDSLNSLGQPRLVSGLSVLMHFTVFDSEGLFCGMRNLCVGFGLDPVQALVISDLANAEPLAFHNLYLDEDHIFEFVSASVIPDVHLAAFNATIDGRDPEIYDDLVRRTTSNKEFLNTV